MIGVLGGMGPAATIDFMAKVLRLVPASRDQEHVPLLVVSDPRIPDRVGPILGGHGPSPLEPMLEALRRLEDGGAKAIVMPCHTAHAWAGELAAATRLPFLHIVDATMDDVAERTPGGPIALLATRATLAAGLYQGRLAASARPPLTLEDEATGRLLLPAIALVKQGRPEAAAALLHEAIGMLAGGGARSVLLACTELPVAYEAAPFEPVVPVVDATLALARAAVTWWTRHGC